MSNEWWLVTLTLETSAEEMASAILFDHGSTGIVTLHESPDSVTLAAYFNERSAAQHTAQSIASELSLTGHPTALRDCIVSSVVEEDWLQKWKEGFEAVQIGESLMVAPSWRLPKEDCGRIVIQIDPGMAFGTGTHETTRLCLESIERHWRGGSLLDIGTGTGILAIGAALLQPGARVVGIDIDPRAVEVARENVEINNLASQIDLRVGQPQILAGNYFDVVVANLTAEVIVDLMPDLVGCVSNTGLMILSGILSILVSEVEAALISAGFTIIERKKAGEWTILVASNF
ncbi:MAG TPA: 50S ribosomal protein L11 methyltransferase [Blastocatellia bacterium]|nr:50S ribosomal protein L11 methyltransferase [Blastocatellia bacterium]